MSKKNAYSCQSCGAIHFKWVGKCPDCGEWNSLVEEFAEGGSHFTRLSNPISSSSTSVKLANEVKKVDLVDLNGDAPDFPRVQTNINELDRVLGGGLGRSIQGCHSTANARRAGSSDHLQQLPHSTHAGHGWKPVGRDAEFNSGLVQRVADHTNHPINCWPIHF